MLDCFENDCENAIADLPKFVRSALIDLRRARSLALAIFIRNVAQRYRYSYLGYLWAMAPVCFTAFAVAIGQQARWIQHSSGQIPAGFYAVFGVVLLQTFLDGFSAHRVIFSGNRFFLKKPGSALESMIIAAMMENFLNLIVRLLLVAIAILLFHIVPAPTVWQLPFGLLALSLSGASVGLLLASGSTLVRDVEHSMIFVPWLLMAVTPIFTQSQSNSILSMVYQYNPLTYIFQEIRDVTYGAATDHGAAIFALMFGALIALGCGWFLCRVSRPYVFESMLE